MLGSLFNFKKKLQTQIDEQAGEEEGFEIPHLLHHLTQVCSNLRTCSHDPKLIKYKEFILAFFYGIVKLTKLIEKKQTKEFRDLDIDLTAIASPILASKRQFLQDGDQVQMALDGVLMILIKPTINEKEELDELNTLKIIEHIINVLKLIR